MRPARPNGHGASSELLLAREEQIRAIADCEAPWRFSGGAFNVLIPDTSSRS